MPLKGITRWNPDADYGSGVETAVINTDDIQSVVRYDRGRGSSDYVLIKFRNGENMYAIGRPEDFLKGE